MILQIDRDAAADYWREYVAKTGEVIVERAIRTGQMDDCESVQLFARHRAAASGISRRDWFAGRALTGLVDMDHGTEWGMRGKNHAADCAAKAYVIADASGRNP